MHGQATAEIHGTIASCIELRTSTTGERYGVFTVAVKRSIEKDLFTQENVYKTDYFDVYIRNLDYFYNHLKHIKEGVKVMVIGELDKANIQSLKSTLQLPLNNQEGSIIINVVRKSGIAFLM